MQLGVLQHLKGVLTSVVDARLARTVVFPTASASVSSFMPGTHHGMKPMARVCKACLLGR